MKMLTLISYSNYTGLGESKGFLSPFGHPSDHFLHTSNEISIILKKFASSPRQAQIL